jgi:hypothetical protein
MSKIWVELRYGVMPHGTLLSLTDNPRLLVLTKREILGRLKTRLAEVVGADEILELIDRSELDRLQKVLDMLIPPELEALYLSQDGDRDGEEAPD